MIFETNVQYTKKVHDLHNDLPFLLERLKIKNVEKISANLHENEITSTKS